MVVKTGYFEKKVIAPIIWIIGVFTLISLVLPLVSLMMKAPWSRLLHNLSHPAVVSALKVSFASSLVIAIMAALLGVPLAYFLNRSNGLVKKYSRILVVSILVFPPTVAGLSLVAFLGTDSLVGSLLKRHFNFTFSGSFLAVVISGLFVGLPFLILVVEASLNNLDLELEKSAQTEGASANKIFWFVTLPQILPAVISGMTLTWARALGEFGATMTFAGAFKGKTFTSAMQVYADLKVNPSSAYSLSAFMVIFSVAILALLQSKWIPAIIHKK